MRSPGEQFKSNAHLPSWPGVNVVSLTLPPAHFLLQWCRPPLSRREPSAWKCCHFDSFKGPPFAVQSSSGCFVFISAVKAADYSKWFLWGYSLLQFSLFSRLKAVSPSKISWHFREVYYSAVLEECGILFVLQTVKYNPPQVPLLSPRVTSRGGIPSVLDQRPGPDAGLGPEGKSSEQRRC